LGRVVVTPVPYGWLFRLAQVTTRDEMQAICRQALADGANPANVAAAIVEWEALQDEQVTTWEMS
jgi:hypothetical protein